MTKAHEGTNRIQRKGRKPKPKYRETAIALHKSGMEPIAIKHHFEDRGQKIGISTIYGYLRNKS